MLHWSIVLQKYSLLKIIPKIGIFSTRFFLCLEGLLEGIVG